MPLHSTFLPFIFSMILKVIYVQMRRKQSSLLLLILIFSGSVQDLQRSSSVSLRNVMRDLKWGSCMWIWFLDLLEYMSCFSFPSIPSFTSSFNLIRKVCSLLFENALKLDFCIRAVETFLYIPDVIHFLTFAAQAVHPLVPPDVCCLVFSSIGLLDSQGVSLFFSSCSLNRWLRLCWKQLPIILSLTGIAVKSWLLGRFQWNYLWMDGPLNNYCFLSPLAWMQLEKSLPEVLQVWLRNCWKIWLPTSHIEKSQ